jgi:hypothetical protein
VSGRRWRARGEVRRARGGFIGAGEHDRGRGSDKRSGRARSGVWHSVEHEAAQREVEYKSGLAPNL